jgi:hypothetical protein
MTLTLSAKPAASFLRGVLRAKPWLRRRTLRRVAQFGEPLKWQIRPVGAVGDANFHSPVGLASQRDQRVNRACSTRPLLSHVRRTALRENDGCDGRVELLMTGGRKRPGLNLLKLSRSSSGSSTPLPAVAVLTSHTVRPVATSLRRIRRTSAGNSAVAPWSSRLTQYRFTAGRSYGSTLI